MSLLIFLLPVGQDSTFPICLLLSYKSTQLPSYTLEQDVAEAKTTKGDFEAWNFPMGIVSISEV